ncbi:ribokinase [Cohnella hashimotonis]|uniref:Deoxyribokinase n=1 Tax=Cohnella hashimotonis TaxID=2826895 RepID=A0ABT6TAG0_9BACL|nr:ribokinase [Cohnella hashimotonis]MDI4643818.1 ribokinase [Cohnella hashimotonis]
MTIVVAGSVMMDIVLSTERYPERGETVFGSGLRFSPGGKGANQATTVAKLGMETCFIGCVGEDAFGHALIDRLRGNGVLTACTRKTSETRSGTAQITIDASGENTIIVHRGANDSLSVEDIDACGEYMGRCKILLVQMEVPAAVTIHAMRAAKRHGATVILDPAPAGGIDLAALPYADIIVPNQQETKILTQIDVRSVDTAVEAALYLHRQFGIAKSIVKMGRRGSLVYQDGAHEHIPAVPVEAVDTVGAGDTFAGALAYALAKGRRLADAARFATIVSALKVTRHGSQDGIPDMGEVEAFCRARGLDWRWGLILRKPC